MSRQYIDCRESPSGTNCTVALSADSAEELLEAAVQHAVAAHKQPDTPALRDQLRKAFREGEPPAHRWPEEGETPAYLKQELEVDEE